MNSIQKQNFISYSQETYVAIKVNYSYTLNGTSSSCRSFFTYINGFSCDFTLIASVMGESGICHGIGRNDIPAK